MPDLYTAKPAGGETPVEIPKVPKPIPVKISPPTINFPLSAFLIKPDRVKFENQKDDETVLLLLRRHWFTNLRWIVMIVLLFFAPLLFSVFPFFPLLPERYQLFSGIAWYLLLIAFLFSSFLNWYFNAAIITDKRVVDVDFYGLLYKEISGAELNNIQDVTQQHIGAVRTVLDFGNVLIQTAGEKTTIEFEDIPHPSRVADLIESLT